MRIKILCLLLIPILYANKIEGQNQTIFRENFKNNKHNWSLISDEDLTVTIKDRSLIFEKKEKNMINNGCLWYSKSISKFATDKNFHISFNAKILYWDDITNNIDFQWGLIDESDSLHPKRHLYQLDFSSDAVRLSKFEQNKGWEYYHWSPSFSKGFCKSFYLEPFTTCKYDIIQRGAILLVNINDINVFTTQIIPIKGSSIGVQQCLRSKWKMSNIVIRQ